MPKNFVKAEGPGYSVTVEWDTESRELVVRKGGDSIPVLACMDAKITAGIVGDEEFYWMGNYFAVTNSLHKFLSDEYPTVDLEAEYLVADEWCGKKKPIFRPKLTHRFLVNWFKKARTGDSRCGGVVI